MKVGHVPLVEYHRPGRPRVADLVSKAIEERQARGGRLRAVMLDRLGPNVWGDTPASAMATLEELEETAPLWLMAHPKPAPWMKRQLMRFARPLGLIGRNVPISGAEITSSVP